jgi:hypothetical protein
MLREQIGEETGKVAAHWVLSVDGGAKVEGSFESTGKLLGVQVVRGSRTGRRSGQMEAWTARRRASSWARVTSGPRSKPKGWERSSREGR